MLLTLMGNAKRMTQSAGNRLCLCAVLSTEPLNYNCWVDSTEQPYSDSFCNLPHNEE